MTKRKFHGNAIIRQIVDRRHVGDSDESVIEYAKSRMKAGAFDALKPADQRAFVAEVVRVHRANQKLYDYVDRGGFGALAGFIK